MEEDCLSNLPESILHDILSRLSQKDVVRTSILSKAWAETWSTFPILSFSNIKIIGEDFIELEDYPRDTKIFCDYVERKLLRFRNQGLNIKQLKLTLNNLKDISKDVDLWLKLASKSGVEVLELCRCYDSCMSKGVQEQCYILPRCVLEAKSLTKLVLRGRIRVDLTFTNHPMKNFSLQVLTLVGVCFVNEHALEDLISCCPLIECITLSACSVYLGGEKHLHDSKYCRIKSLSIHGLVRLKTVDVCGIQEVFVDAPCLENLYYHRDYWHAPCKIDFDKCRNLRWLSLVYSKNTVITDKGFLELFLKFPFLEGLKIVDCTLPERINISSDRLKMLELQYCFNMKEVNIDAPNLLSCSYFGFGHHDMKPLLSFLRYSSQLVVDILMFVSYHALCNLREFVQNIKPQTVLASISLFIDQLIPDELDPIVLQVSSPPPSIKQLILKEVPNNEALYLPIVNKLLSSCCPTTISLFLDSFQCSRAFIEVLYETLMGTNKDKCFCRSCQTKCWWHDLKSVEVTSSMTIGENVDFKTILDARQTPASPETIDFKIQF